MGAGRAGRTEHGLRLVDLPGAPRPLRRAVGAARPLPGPGGTARPVGIAARHFAPVRPEPADGGRRLLPPLPPVPDPTSHRANGAGL